MKHKLFVLGNQELVATLCEGKNGREIVFFYNKNVDLEHGLKIIDIMANEVYDKELIDMIEWLLFPWKDEQNKGDE